MDAPASDLTGKARIRHAALRLFAHHGVEGTSMRAIAEEASVTVGLITHHYGSKAGLHREVDAAVADDFAAAIASVPAEGTARDVALRRDAAVAEMLRARPDVLEYVRRHVLLGEPAADSQLVEKLTALAREQVRQLRAAGLISGRRDEVPQVVSMIMRMLGELFFEPLVDRIVDAVDRDAARPAVVVRVQAAEDETARGGRA